MYPEYDNETAPEADLPEAVYTILSCLIFHFLYAKISARSSSGVLMGFRS